MASHKLLCLVCLGQFSFHVVIQNVLHRHFTRQVHQLYIIENKIINNIFSKYKTPRVSCIMAMFVIDYQNSISPLKYIVRANFFDNGAFTALNLIWLKYVFMSHERVSISFWVSNHKYKIIFSDEFGIF